MGASKPSRSPKTVKFSPSKRNAPPSVQIQKKPSRVRITSLTRLLGNPSRVLQCRSDISTGSATGAERKLPVATRNKQNRAVTAEKFTPQG
jgi:hypothetical protein